MNTCDKGTGYLRIINAVTGADYDSSYPDPNKRKPVWPLYSLTLPNASASKKAMSIISFMIHMHGIRIHIDPPGSKRVMYGYTAETLTYYPPPSEASVQATGMMDITISNVTYTILPKPGTSIIKCGLFDASQFMPGAPADMKGVGILYGQTWTPGEIVGQIKVSCLVGGVPCESQIVDLQAQ